MRCPAACFRLLLLASVLCFALAGPARAGFVITSGPATVPLGGVADIRFAISSDAADSLSSFQVQLLITPATAGELQFVDAAARPFSFLTDPNYVFSGNSLDQSPPASPFWNTVSDANYPSDTLTGGDTALSGPTAFPSQHTLDGSYLLATARVVAPPSLTSAGEVFSISLVPASGDSTDQSATYFTDGPVSFGGSAVLVTVTAEQANAVPAPPGLVLAVVGGLTSLLGCWWRRRKARPASGA